MAWHPSGYFGIQDLASPLSGLLLASLSVGELKIMDVASEDSMHQ